MNRIAFVRAEYAPDGSCRTEVFAWRRGSLTPAEGPAAKNALVLLVVCGHGVVTKADDSQITARIKADPETFLWSSAGGKTSFVRRERLQNPSEELAAQGIVPVRIFCADAAADFDSTSDELARQLYAELRWKELLKPVPESSAALQALVRRVAFPVLGLFLCLLAGNALLSPRLNVRRQALQSQIDGRERTVSDAASSGARQREQLAAFAVRPATPRSVVCDRIARAVPQPVVLTALEIEPLAKRFETRKLLLHRENTAVVCGSAPTAADVSAFVQRLSELTCCRTVRLTHVEKERDGDRLLFRIETAL